MQTICLKGCFVTAASALCNSRQDVVPSLCEGVLCARGHVGSREFSKETSLLDQHLSDVLGRFVALRRCKDAIAEGDVAAPQLQ
jgi:hypothetical protein